MFGSTVFYPGLLGNEEDKKIKLPLHDQYNVRFGPEPRAARLTFLFNFHKEEYHVSFS
jgi:hypothetical protein